MAAGLVDAALGHGLAHDGLRQLTARPFPDVVVLERDAPQVQSLDLIGHLGLD